MQYKQALAEAKKQHGIITEKAKEDAIKQALPADELLKQLFQRATIYAESQASRDAARWRAERGKPPGKDLVVGDRLNWEILLEFVPKPTSLHLISADSDFRSLINPNSPLHLLSEEWSKTNGGDLFLHQTFTAFLELHFPEIKLASDVEKSVALERFCQSPTFTATHAAIVKLKQFIPLLTSDDRKMIVHAATSNSQIFWICEDADVKEFLSEIVGDSWDEYPEEIQSKLWKFNIPF